MSSHNKTKWFNSFLAEEIEHYLTYKRALGCRFDDEESGLRLFDRFLVERRVLTLKQVTHGLVEEFLRSRPTEGPRNYNHLLGAVRRLLKRLIVLGRLRSLPALPVPRRIASERLPFIFDRSSAKQLLDQALKLHDHFRAPLRGITYNTIFAILYGLGLRVGEVCRLQHRDVDLNRQLLCIRQSKFGKTRLIPFGPRMAKTIKHYLRSKAKLFKSLAPEEPVFSFNRSAPISRHTINQVFRELVGGLGLSIPPGIYFPRTHDLRHSFAVGTLLRWYRSGINPSTRLLSLSTFLGHGDIESTAVYLTITSELLQEANHRFEGYAAPAVRET